MDEDCTVQLPCRGEEFEGGQDVTTQSLEQILSLTPSNPPGSFALTVAVSCLLMKATKYCLSVKGGACRIPPWDPTSPFASISSKLDSLEARYQIGGHFDFAAVAEKFQAAGRATRVDLQYLILANALWYLSQCLLYHPLLLLRRPNIANISGHGARNFFRRALESVREHAAGLSRFMKEISIAGYCSKMSMHGYCLLVPSTVHILNLSSTDPAVQEESSQLLESNIEILKELSLTWPSAKLMVINLSPNELCCG